MAHLLPDGAVVHYRSSTAASNILPSFEQSAKHDRPRADGAEEVTRTRHCTPVTPTQRLTAIRRAHVVGEEGIVSPLHSANDMRSCECLSTHHLSGEQSPFAQQLGSSKKGPNIRVRRSTCSSALLRSPARAGYTERMRRIFENAGHEQQTPRTSTVGLYPQLPNISRKASAPTVKNEATCLELICSSSYRPESLCLSMNLLAGASAHGEGQASLPHLSERSSGSWSDDSGYIITTSRGRSCSFLPPLKELIYSWLAETSDPGDSAVDGEYESDLTVCAVSNSLSGEHGMSSGFKTARRGEDDATLTLSDATFLSSSPTAEDAFQADDNFPDVLSTASISEARPKVDAIISNEHNTWNCLTLDRIGENYTQCQNIDETAPQQLTSKTKTNTSPADAQVVEERGIQLSPLSPNVCIERGPTRYHSIRNLPASNITTTPCRDRTSKPALTAQMKENVLIEEKNNRDRKILTPRGNGLSIRSRLLQ